MTHDPTKAAHYIRLLDEARCEGNWDNVPELVRKIRKHAPDRTCLTLTAECEHAITQASKNTPSSPHLPNSRPSTATTVKTVRSQAISNYIPQLIAAIDAEQLYVEDEFQAQVCLGWLHWYLGEPALAASRLPYSIEQDYAQLDGTNKESVQWTKVCALKALYIKGSSQHRTGVVAEAIETFESGLPILTSISGPAKDGKEFRSWTELFLTSFCMVSSYAIKSKISSVLETETLSAFRSWSRFWDSQTSLPAGGRALNSDVPRRHVWREYYVTISDLLQQELPYPTTSLTPAYAQASTRLQQRAELKGVEAKYETLLLNETAFPGADEANEEVESFVEIVMANWHVLCGCDWKEEDLGEGGSEAVSRGVLDILYRAATKTFHSTAILRHLFTVHQAVAEFDLAFKAFDTYLEIVKRGKARVEKTGEPEHGLDDDETVLKTTSECIRALCQYGSLQGAEKAKDLGLYFENWLEKHHPSQASIDMSNGNGHRLENGNLPDLGTKISPRMFAIAWRCIGIGHAQWGRLTFDASSRAEVQLRAIKCFRKSLLPEYHSTNDVETLFALGVVLAERRELGAAVEVVKAALLPPKQGTTSTQLDLKPHAGRFARERSLIPLWHLLAILLSARQEFITAARACEGAFEQFQDPRNLFGDGEFNGEYRSEHLNGQPHAEGVVDDMTDSEKNNVLEVKMTQLAIIEVLEGPDVAVNASDELLSLYSRLFGDPQRDTATPVPQQTAFLPPPPSSAGTIKSIKGSIFGRSSRRRSIRNQQTTTSLASDNTLVQTRPQTMAGSAPTISVTNEKGEDGKVAKKHLHGHVKDHPPPHNGKLEKRSESLSRKMSSGSPRNRSNSAGRKRSRSQGQSATVVEGEQFFTPPVDSQNREEWISDASRGTPVGLAISPETISTQSSVKGSPSKPLPPKSQNMSHRQKELKPAHSDAELAQDGRLPSIPTYASRTTPTVQFSKSQQRRRRAAILVKVWLLIAGFYRRASMYEDCRGAIEEASKLTQSLEEDVSRDTTGTVSIEHAGWGGGKSVSELCGDVFSDRGYLALAESSPYAALSNFESALSHFPDHPSAIVGLSNILLDIYTEVLPPTPAEPVLDFPGLQATASASATNTTLSTTSNPKPSTNPSSTIPLQPGPLGFAIPFTTATAPTPLSPYTFSNSSPETAQLDRLAARDRAYGLLSTLTKLGTGWNNSEAWFALARAYEEGGQVEKAKSVLWWCVELEEGRGIRGYEALGSYVL